MRGIIISAFPGVGKSTYTKSNPDICSDSDSSKFSWVSEGVRNPNFIEDYLRHIKEEIKVKQIVFVSSHKDVREALIKEGLSFYLVYPDKGGKEEYLNRYRKRKSPESFISLIENNWDNFLDDCIDQEGELCQHVEINPKEQIKDIVKEIRRKDYWLFQEKLHKLKWAIGYDRTQNKNHNTLYLSKEFLEELILRPRFTHLVYRGCKLILNPDLKEYEIISDILSEEEIAEKEKYTTETLGIEKATFITDYADSRDFEYDKLYTPR